MTAIPSAQVRLWRRGLVLFVLLSFSLAPATFAHDSSKLVFFGDSLSDPENYFIRVGTGADVPSDTNLAAHHLGRGRRQQMARPFQQARPDGRRAIGQGRGGRATDQARYT